MAELAVHDLALRYGETDILRGVSVRVPRGKVVALLGPSGSGKTALLRAIAGLETPYRGSIAVGEKVLFDAERKINLPAEARGLGLVLQSYALWPHRTVFENVAYGLKLRNVATADIKKRVEQALGQIELGHLAERYPQELSGGQQQRVALARALIYEPAVILLDEPFSNLDARLREEARTFARQLIASFDLSALIVTHDRTEAMAIADRITLLNAGLIEQEGTPADLYRDPATRFAAEFMGHNNRLEGTLVERADKTAVLEVMGLPFEGVARTGALPGEKVTGVMRVEKMQIGGGPGPNRILMSLKAQTYMGERWELVFVKGGLSVRAYTAAPLKHEFYHVEFPSNALWVF